MYKILSYIFKSTFLVVLLITSCTTKNEKTGLTQEQEVNLELAENYLEEGNQFHLQGKYFECIEPFLRCKKIIEDNELQEQRVYALLCDRLGHTFFYYGDYEKTKTYLLEWYKHPHDSLYTPENVYNTLGLTYSRLGDYDSSNFFFEIGLQKAKERNALDWIGLISGNKAANLLLKGETDEVLTLFQTDYEYSLAGKNTISAAIVMISIAEFYAKENNWIEVEKALDEATRLFEQTEYALPHNYYTVKGQLLAKKADCEGAIFHSSRGAFIRDSLVKLRDNTRIKSIEFSLYTEEKSLEIQSLEQEKKNAFRISWITVVIFVIFIVFILIFINQEKSKNKKNKSILEYRARLVQEELKNTRDSLSGLMHGLNERNEIIKKLDQEIQQLNTQNANDETSAKKEKLSEQLQDYRLLTEDDWINFKKIFNQLHPNFLDALTAKYPAITNAEKRIACLIRLNLSNSEMGNTLGISTDSVRKTQLRLRNKLSIGTQEELIDFLFSIKA